MLSNVHWAFEERSLVLTDYGAGVQARRRAPDLVLPTGELSLGWPGGDAPAPACSLPPGRYPVYHSIHEPEERSWRSKRLLFVRVVLRDEVPARWEEAGRTFTDSGTGLLYDQSLSPALQSTCKRLGTAVWRAARDASLDDEPGGSILLDEASGGNVLLFRTDDSWLPLLVGRDAASAPVCALVVVYQDAAAR